MHSIYLHIPFCKSRCRYCDFFSTTYLDRREEYVQAILQEINLRANEIGSAPLRSIYFGGGTPSLLSVDDIQKLLCHLPASTHSSIEITMEANPGDLDLDKLQALRNIGINRLSIGIQSLQDSLLQTIGRRHNAQQAMDAVHWAQEAGFDNISIDLMYGLPGQTYAMWQSDVQLALTLGIQHISCYCLSYEQGTALTQMRDRGEVAEQDEDTLNRMYDYLCNQCTQHGLEHYEISNFALPNFRSQHNSGYWTDVPYVGLGAGAHSYDGQHRRWNVSNLDAYILGVQEDQGYWEQETLTQEQKQMEHIMLGLRTIEGIELSLVAHREDVVHRYIQQGLLTSASGRVHVTQAGSHILNRIIEDLI